MGSGGKECDSEGCENWCATISIRKCIECRRKDKREREAKICQWPDCGERFNKAGQARYCILHRGLPPPSRS